MSLLSPLYPRPNRPWQPPQTAARRGWGAPYRRTPRLDPPPHPRPHPGHVSFFRRSDSTLLVGDAFCTTRPESFFEAAIAQPPELHGPPAYFTSDWSGGRRASVQKAGGARARSRWRWVTASR